MSIGSKMNDYMQQMNSAMETKYMESVYVALWSHLCPDKFPGTSFIDLVCSGDTNEVMYKLFRFTGLKLQQKDYARLVTVCAHFLSSRSVDDLRDYITTCRQLTKRQRDAGLPLWFMSLSHITYALTDYWFIMPITVISELQELFHSGIQMDDAKLKIIMRRGFVPKATITSLVSDYNTYEIGPSKLYRMLFESLAFVGPVELPVINAQAGSTTIARVDFLDDVNPVKVGNGNSDNKLSFSVSLLIWLATKPMVRKCKGIDMFNTLMSDGCNKDVYSQESCSIGTLRQYGPLRVLESDGKTLFYYGGICYVPSHPPDIDFEQSPLSEYLRRNPSEASASGFYRLLDLFGVNKDEFDSFVEDTLL